MIGTCGRPWASNTPKPLPSGFLLLCSERLSGASSSQNVAVTTLGEADPANADMATLIIVGSRETRTIARPSGTPLVYTPRAAAEAST